MTTPNKTHRPPDSPHGLPAVDVLAALEVSVSTGLSEEEAGLRFEQLWIKYDRLAAESRRTCHPCSSVSRVLWLRLLAVAAAVAFYFREWEEGGAIVGVLILNTAIGFVTEIKAVRSIEAIRALGSRSARVLRGGQHTPHSGRAVGAGRHCPARCRRCYFGGPAACGGRRTSTRMSRR